jgi:Leucine-rich repeat (LRR) protein
METFRIEKENGLEQIVLIQDEINGGKTSINEIDKIGDFQKVNRIQISGLDQETFEYFIYNYGNQFKSIYFFKCPRIQNLEPLSALENIEEIDFFWNQKASRLWNFSKNHKLTTLKIDSFIHLNSLDDFKVKNKIEIFKLSTGFNGKKILPSIEPLTYCKRLKKLNLSINKIEDNEVKYFLEIKSLEELNFPTNLFTTEQVAWLKAHLNENIKSNTINAIKLIQKPLNINSKMIDTIIVGKRKPMLSSADDKVRIEKYMQNFDNLVLDFKNKK